MPKPYSNSNQIFPCNAYAIPKTTLIAPTATGSPKVRAAAPVCASVLESVSLPVLVAVTVEVAEEVVVFSP